MILGNRGKIVLASLLVAGCYPLEQAPLIYTSKQQVGVTVSGGTPDSPGLDVNIGYKGLDTATVPVAVAKSCPKNESALNPCSDMHRLQIVGGVNNTSSSGRTSEEVLRSVEADFDKVAAELEQLRKDIFNLSGRVAAAKAIPAKRQELAALNDPKDADGNPRSLTPEEEERKKMLTKDVDEAEDAAMLEPRLEALKVDADSKQGQLASLAKRRQQLEEIQNISTGKQMNDALSLYGSFNGDSKGDANGAGLALGKVFATGVAAQHITEDLGFAAMSACIESGLKTLPASPSPSQLANLRWRCGYQMDTESR